MARIFESTNKGRRSIKLTTDDVISVVREYQRVVNQYKNIDNIRDCLENTVIYIPEDV